VSWEVQESNVEHFEKSSTIKDMKIWKRENGEFAVRRDRGREKDEDE